MSNIPTGRIEDQLIWLENHATLWQSVESEVGLSTTQVTQLKSLVQEARSRYTDARAAREASKNATTAQTAALRAARNEASDLIDTIKSFIANTANSEGLWAVAGLNPPAPRGTTPPPNAPTNLSASVDSLGNVVVRWKARQPAQGTVYSITRAFNNAPTFTLIDVVGEKQFVDSTVPLGTSSVSYVIVAKRSGTTSTPSERLTVQFGRTGVGSGRNEGLTIVGAEYGSKAAA